MSAVVGVARYYSWYSRYDSMLHLFAYLLLLGLYDSMLGILGTVACRGCLYVDCIQLKNEVSTFSTTASGMAR